MASLAHCTSTHEDYSSSTYTRQKGYNASTHRKLSMSRAPSTCSTYYWTRYYSLCFRGVALVTCPLYETHFLCTLPCISLPGAALFSRSRRRGGACIDYGASLGPGRALCRVLWALKSAWSWRFAGSLSDEPEPSRTMKIQTERITTRQVFPRPAGYHSSQIRGRHVTAVATLQALSLWQQRTSFRVCVRLCVRVCAVGLLWKFDIGFNILLQEL